MYPDANVDCQACDIACEDCTGPNANECSNCKANYALLNGNTCTTDCGAGKWNNIATKVCTACLSNCGSCTDATTCDACEATYYKKVQLGVTSCT